MNREYVTIEVDPYRGDTEVIVSISEEKLEDCGKKKPSAQGAASLDVGMR